jgi:hypothetical protein
MAALAVVALLYYAGHQMKLRIVPDGGGALMAVDTDGLRQLNALYTLPKVCDDTVLRAKGGQPCAVRLAPDAVTKGRCCFPLEQKRYPWIRASYFRTADSPFLIHR